MEPIRLLHLLVRPSGGAAIGTGVAPTAIDAVIGITKAYCTRVGGGPFPTELNDEVGENLRARGNEYGAVTGRPRRLRLAGSATASLCRNDQRNFLASGHQNGCTRRGLAEIPICVGYKINGKVVKEIPAHASGYDGVEGVYKTLPGWRTPTQNATKFSDLPKAARDYLAFIENETEARVGMVSTGPEPATNNCCGRLHRAVKISARPKQSRSRTMVVLAVTWMAKAGRGKRSDRKSSPS
jgi:adenylosuccinate synthase